MGVQRQVSASQRGIMLLAIVLGVLLGGLAQAQGFKFPDENEAQRARDDEESARRARVEQLLSTPCRARIKNQKIMVLIGTNQNGVVSARQADYSAHFDAIGRRLRALGLRTYTQDAAISASRRLAAQYILRGLISTTATRNPIINLNQVSIQLDFILTGANGRMISEANAKNESYSGEDTLGMALTLINERADEVVAQLYSDYCQTAGAK